MRIGKVLVGVLAIVLLLTGCSSSSDSTSYESYDYSDGVAYTNEAYGVSEEAYGIDYQDTEKKLVRTVTVRLESDDPVVTDNLIRDKMLELNGYYENHDCSNYYSISYDMTIRLPREVTDEFIEYLSSMKGASVKSCSDSVVDKTLEYTDTEALKENLVAEREVLQELLVQATEVSDLIEIQDRLTDINYQIDSAERQLRKIDDKVDYTTVCLYIDATSKYQQIGWGEKFIESWSDKLETAGDVLIAFITSIPVVIVAIPFVVIIGLLFGLFVKAVRFITKGSFRKKRKEE